MYRRLNELVLDVMGKMAQGNYSPAARFNAMLAIGELTEEPESHKLQPLPDALKVLVAAVKNNDLPDNVRVAAMIGVLRHAELGVNDEDRKPVGDLLLAAVGGNVALKDPQKDSQVRDWFVGLAVTGLGYLGTVGDNQAAFQAIVKTIADTDRSLCTRALAVEALGQIDYSEVSGIDAANTAAVVAQFAKDACNEELKLNNPNGPTATWNAAD